MKMWWRSFLLICSIPFGSSVQKLLAFDGFKGDQFGSTTSLFQDRLAITAIGDDDYGSYTGSVYIFQSYNGGWSLQTKIVPLDGQSDGYFGDALSLFGDTLIVGAYSTAYIETQEPYAGAVYIYNNIESAWTQTGKLSTQIPDYMDYFGHSVSMYEDLLVIGADGVDDSTGGAYIYSRQPATLSWSFQHKLVAEGSYDWVGKAVDIYENTVLVSNTDYGNNAGAVLVYTGNLATGWTQSSQLVASDPFQSDYFGMSFSLHGDTLAVGAYLDDDKGFSSGSVYLFNSIGGQWTQSAKLVPADGSPSDEFGASVSLYGSNLIVSSANDDDKGTYSGSAYLYHGMGSQWSLSAKITADDGRANAFYGTPVCLYELQMVVSARKSDDAGIDSGSAYVYNITALPTVSPTFMPSTSPTFNPTSIPSVVPTLTPSVSPTSSPSFSPTFSMAPSNSLELVILFSVSQLLVDMDYDAYMSDINGSNFNFIQSLVAVVPDLSLNEVKIMEIYQTVNTSSLLRHHHRILSLSDVVLIYNVTHIIPEGSTDTETAYNNLVSEITTASTGTNCNLAVELRSQGGPFTSITMTDNPPDTSTYSVYIEHSPFPTSIPTSAPSCGIGSEGTTGDDCNKCPPGTYSKFPGNECKKCDIGYYCDSYGCNDCKKCPHPWTTVETGQSECKAIQLHFPHLIVYTLLIIVIVLYFIAIFFLAKARLACLVIMTLPLFDVLTDILYLTLSVFYGLESFLACSIILAIIPNFVFLGIIIQQKALPRIFYQKYLTYLLFLAKSPTGYPTAGGVEIFKSLTTHDSIIKLLYFTICWFIALFGQLIALLPAGLLLLAHVPFWCLWLFIGTFLYQSKIISIGTIWNMWFELWTGSTAGSFTTTMALETRVFNKSLLTEFLFESLPQLGIQCYNNTRLHRWTLLGYISTAISLFMTVDGIWRISYYKIYSGYSFRDIPVGMGIIKFVPDSQLKKLLDVTQINSDSFHDKGCIEAAERTMSSAPPLDDKVHVVVEPMKSAEDIASIIRDISKK